MQRLYLGGCMFTGKNMIRIKALCLFSYNDHLFVSESFDSVKNDYYYRPIGGTVEFGEHTVATLHREIREELSTEITHVTLMTVLENIFICDGMQGHEIDFVYTAEFADASFYEIKDYYLNESNGEKVKALWLPKNDLLSGRYRMVPEKLREFLLTHHTGEAVFGS